MTHFHADHVDGLPGVLHGRSVGEIEVSPLALPELGVTLVQAVAAEVPIRSPPLGERVSVGTVSWTVVGPVAVTSDSPNDASLVLLVEVGGLRLLLTGDVEPEGQRLLRRAAPTWGRIDVLKVPHHGSRYQDLGFLTGLGAPVALVSVGAGNDYGHPASGTIGALEAAGTQVWRTDLDGDLAVVVRPDGLRVVPRR